MKTVDTHPLPAVWCGIPPQERKCTSELLLFPLLGEKERGFNKINLTCYHDE